MSLLGNDTPHTGLTQETPRNIDPLLTYLDQQEKAALGKSGTEQVARNLYNALRVIGTRPIDPSMEDPSQIANVMNDLFELIDVFSVMGQLPDRTTTSSLAKLDEVLGQGAELYQKNG